MNSNVQAAWEDFLNPDIQRSRLVMSSIFIAVFQSLKEAIVDRVKGSFLAFLDEKNALQDTRYATEVLSKNKSIVYASLAWLKEQDAIDLTDVETFDKIKACRNLLAHQLLNVVSTSGLPSDFEERFEQIAKLLRKIEIWWIRNFEDVDERVADDQIMPGRCVSLDILYRVAIEGNRYFYDAIKSLGEKSKSRS